MLAFHKMHSKSENLFILNDENGIIFYLIYKSKEGSVNNVI